jgi:transposase
MIVIGADTHKGSHALAGVDEGTGRVRGQREIKADQPGHLAAVRWARGLDEDRIWAIEDCRHVSRRLEQALLAAGERVVGVAPHRMGASRKGGAGSRASRIRLMRWRSRVRSSRTGSSSSRSPI